MATITNYEMERRKLVAKAGSAFLDAMSKFTKDNAELTAAEWLKAINDAVVVRILAQELSDQWRPSAA